MSKIARLVLEHSGKLVKNINVTIDSPFEKFLKADKTPVDFVDAEVQDIVEDIPEMPDNKLQSVRLKTRKSALGLNILRLKGKA